MLNFKGMRSITATTMTKTLLVVLLCAAAASCSCSEDNNGSGADGDTDNGGGDGTGDGSSSDGADDGDGGSSGNRLTGTLRDFNDTHPDFEGGVITAETGIVEDELGGDGKPVYAGGEGTETTHGREAFDQWYRDVEGVNMSKAFTITLEHTGGGIYTYQNDAFFPIDDELFGNQDREHNYHFTLEIHTRFKYKGGEVFRFTGDDDLFVFVNGRLALDLGGVHGEISGEIDFDDQADELGITPEHNYTLDFFFAERHTTESNFRIDTTIAEFLVI